MWLRHWVAKLLKRSNDVYRQAIFNAQVYANTGAGTYEKAVREMFPEFTFSDATEE